MIKVYKTPCQNCLLSKDAIVSPARKKELISYCLEKETFFICHKASMNNETVCCRKYFDRYKDRVQSLQVATRLSWIQEVEQPDDERLVSYAEMRKEFGA